MIAPWALALALAAAPSALHVNFASAPGGDGSEERPFTKVGDALAAAAPGATIIVATGLYEEPLTITKPVRIEGVGSPVVLGVGADTPVAISVQADLQLSNLIVQGGRIGIELMSGSARLQGVALRGQPDVGLECGVFPCVLREVHLVASFSNTLGVHSRGALDLEDVSSEGPFKHAIEGDTGALVRGRRIRVEDSATALFFRGANVVLSDITVLRARVTGIFVSGGKVEVHEVQIGEVDYGILARGEAVVLVTGAIVSGCYDSCLSAVASELIVRDWVSAGPSRDAAIAVDGSRVDLDGALVFDPGSSGVRARVATGRLAHLTVVRPRLEGESGGTAVYLGDSEMRIDDLDAERPAGPAVQAQMGTSEIRGLTVVGGLAAVSMEHRSKLRVLGLMQRGGTGTGVACIERAEGTIIAPHFERVPGGNWLIDATCHVKVLPASLGPAAP